MRNFDDNEEVDKEDLLKKLQKLINGEDSEDESEDNNAPSESALDPEDWADYTKYGNLMKGAGKPKMAAPSPSSLLPKSKAEKEREMDEASQNEETLYNKRQEELGKEGNFIKSPYKKKLKIAPVSKFISLKRKKALMKGIK